MPQLTPAGKAVILVLVIGGAVGAYRLFGGKAKDGPSSQNVPPIVLPSAGPGTEPDKGVGDFSVTMPGKEPGCTELPEVRLLGYAWNAHMGLHFANGGPQATKGSLMCQNGVNLKFARQDMNDKLTEALVTFATALSRGEKNPTVGAHFVTVMGDGSAAFLKGVDDALAKIGPEYRPKVIGAIGFSRGEDKFMGPADWKKDPQSARGGVIAGVLRDGDWNIAQKWIGDNDLKTNPDEKTYDPDAINWINTSDYLDAGEKYITGYTEERDVVRNGKKTGQRMKIKVDGVVTWTPGDVNVAQKKGGLVSIVSTKEYASQMPCVIIGVDKWCKNNRPIVEGLLKAALSGGEAVQKNDQALGQAAEISAAVYKESDAAYWKKYYKGVTEKDKTGLDVELGGSRANNISDAAYTFGLGQGSANLYAAVYKVFGDLVVKQYPEVVSGYPPADQIQDLSYLKAVVAKAGSGAVSVAQAGGAVPTVTARATGNTNEGSKSKWPIQFVTGRAEFNPTSIKDLEKLKRNLLVASNMVVEIHGHTDNVGDPAKNMQLSEARAFAVKTWLEKQAPVNFKGRISVFSHGQTQPLAPNTTEDGKAKNRRVEIILKAN
ncbi:OmpA family protein [Armatimonas rosea]|uniref:Outer membrane protein OmpA-like peptidoglycan-associated protein n=1 Tax=Armatimonas rosea TaxID=685828 RepID=A0A7W9SQD7_ARMRO|nr:OmpA family protein [Armatimonas rosea]MBB6050530.1 outer membrane protein OmpA-like peptidoglycan-associated protein [Armatimonas rosea]